MATTRPKARVLKHLLLLLLPAAKMGISLKSPSCSIWDHQVFSRVHWASFRKHPNWWSWLLESIRRNSPSCCSRGHGIGVGKRALLAICMSKKGFNDISDVPFQGHPSQMVTCSLLRLRFLFGKANLWQVPILTVRWTKYTRCLIYRLSWWNSLSNAECANLLDCSWACKLIKTDLIESDFESGTFGRLCRT